MALEKAQIRKTIIQAATSLGRHPPDFGSLAPAPDSSGTATPLAVTSADNPKKRKLMGIIDQTTEAEINMIPDSEVRELFRKYSDLQGGMPQPQEEPSGEQISGVRELLRADSAPYVDFAVFGPYGKRQAKMLRFEAQVFVAGQLVTRQVKGPSNFDAWRSAWRVYQVTMMILEASPPGPLDEYEENIRKLNQELPGSWGMIAAADDMMRSEYWERIRREVEAQVAAGTFRGQWLPKQPWATVLRESASNRAWWDEHVRTPALVANLVGRNQTPNRAQSNPTPRPKAKAKSGLRGDSRADGRHIRYQGTEICFSWNRSSSGCAQGQQCPQKRLHVCEWCLGPHRAVDCTSSKKKASSQ